MEVFIHMINSSTAYFLSRDSMGCLGDSTHLSQHHSQDCIYVTDWLGPGLSEGCRPRHIDLNRRQPLHVVAIVRGPRQHSQKKVAKSGKSAIKSFFFFAYNFFFKIFFLMWTIFSLFGVCSNITSLLCFGFLERHAGFQLPDQQSNLRPLHWKAKSSALESQGSPYYIF